MIWEFLPFQRLRKKKTSKSENYKTRDVAQQTNIPITNISTSNHKNKSLTTKNKRANNLSAPHFFVYQLTKST